MGEQRLDCFSYFFFPPPLSLESLVRFLIGKFSLPLCLSASYHLRRQRPPPLTAWASLPRRVASQGLGLDLGPALSLDSWLRCSLQWVLLRHVIHATVIMAAQGRKPPAGEVGREKGSRETVIIRNWFQQQLQKQQRQIADKTRRNFSCNWNINCTSGRKECRGWMVCVCWGR